MILEWRGGLDGIGLPAGVPKSDNCVVLSNNASLLTSTEPLDPQSSPLLLEWPVPPVGASLVRTPSVRTSQVS